MKYGVWCTQLGQSQLDNSYWAHYKNLDSDIRDKYKDTDDKFMTYDINFAYRLRYQLDICYSFWDFEVKEKP